MNIFGKLAVSVLALSVASVASAASISGSTDFRVNLPEILVLYHWDDAVLTLNEVATTPANDSDAGREISDATTRTGSVNLGAANATITGSVDTTAPANGLATSVAVTLQNAWAVRNLSTAAGVSLALTNPNPNLLNVIDNTSVITTTGATLSSGSLTGSTVTIPSGFAPVSGDIKFNLNLSGANRAGEYNTRGVTGASPNDATGNAKDTFLLTLTGTTTVPITGP